MICLIWVNQDIIHHCAIKRSLIKFKVVCLLKVINITLGSFKIRKTTCRYKPQTCPLDKIDLHVKVTDDFDVNKV